MRVELLAHTELHQKHPDYEWHDNEEPTDELAEIAGRLCYRSWDRPNPKTATNKGYLANIIHQQHFSVLEHSSATFWISGVSRSLTHELVRHRHLSFSQVSQRYVDEGVEKHHDPSRGGGEAWDYAEHPVFRYDYDDRGYLLRHAVEPIHAAMKKAREEYDVMVNYLMRHGIDRKTARGAARGILPNATGTEIIVTGNMRSWREFVQKRNSEGADAEIRLLAQEILRQLKEIAPNTFQDM